MTKVKYDQGHSEQELLPIEKMIAFPYVRKRNWTQKTRFLKYLEDYLKQMDTKIPLLMRLQK